LAGETHEEYSVSLLVSKGEQKGSPPPALPNLSLPDVGRGIDHDEL